MLRERIRSVLSLARGRRQFGFRDAAKVVVICLCCLAPVLAVFGRAQSLALPRNDPLFGTWVNAEYDASERFTFAKFVIWLDGHEYDYRHIAETEPVQECWNTLEKAWVDAAGWHQYEIKVISWNYPRGGAKKEIFKRTRISPDGGMRECVSAQYGYPEEVTPLGPCYGIAYRQK